MVIFVWVNSDACIFFVLPPNLKSSLKSSNGTRAPRRTDGRRAAVMRPIDALRRKGYDDVRALARGRHGAVYEARRRACGALCAVKCIPLDDDDVSDVSDVSDDGDASRGRGSMKPATLRRAREEATMLARLGDEHANVATLVEFWVNRDAGAAFIAMRHGGCDIARVVRANWRALSLDVCFDYAIQVGMALRHVHANRIVHGDLKPENVFVDEDNVVVVGDFGSARATRRARAGADVGTPLYNPPEVIKGQAYGTKGDMWALGCLMMCLADGAPPFDAMDRERLRSNIVDVEPRQLCDEFSGDYNDVVMALLEKDPSRRLSAEQFLALPCLESRVARVLARNELRMRATPSPSASSVTERFDADATLLKALATGSNVAKHDELIARVAELEAKNEVLTLKLDAAERAKRDLCDKLERALTMKRAEALIAPSTSYVRTPSPSASFPRVIHTARAPEATLSSCVLSSSASRMLLRDDEITAPISPVRRRDADVRGDTVTTPAARQIEHTLETLFDKADVSPAGPFDLHPSPATSFRSERSSPSAAASTPPPSRDYINDLLRRARRSPDADADIDADVSRAHDASSLLDEARLWSEDDENTEPLSPTATVVSTIPDHHLHTPPDAVPTRRPKTPTAPLRHQSRRVDASPTASLAAPPRARPLAVLRERWAVTPRALFTDP